MNALASALLMTMLLSGSARPVPATAELPKVIRPALDSIKGDDLLRDINVLASDQFEGRAPGSPGEEKTVAFLVERFRALGLKPANPDGSYIQTVPLVGSTALDPTISYGGAGRRERLVFPEQCVIWSKRQVPEVKVDESEILFVGYGAVAPEYGWDDFKDIDVRGKTLLMLVNDPQVPDPKDPEELDPMLFKGRAMTYYGRWTYKFEIAAKRGAAAALVVHETGPAGYPWAVVVGSNARENFDLQAADQNQGRAAIEGWLALDQAKEMCAAAGFDFDTLKRLASSKEFKPVDLGLKASFALKNQLRQVNSRNVIGCLDGSAKKRRGEYLIYTAHWDHLGRDPKKSGDPVYHGALDNASGIAGLLELAQAFGKLPSPPKRTVVFLAVTAEEKGLLGSRYYAQHPVYPLERTLANFNMDGLNPWGRTKDLEVIGAGNSTLEDLLAAAAAGQHRIIKPESQPEKGFFYRSDHFEFAKAGVPSLYFKAGTNYVDRPIGYGQKKIDDYIRNDYHKVTDMVKPGWDMAGAVEDLRLLFQVGWTVAEQEDWPDWKAESEFHARRQANPSKQ